MIKEFLPVIRQWHHENKKIALARVIQTWGSSPRPVGSCMLISSNLEMSGSVSGGCVEGAVLKEAQQVFETGQCKRVTYGVSDEDAWAVGLSCGGKLQVYLQPWNEQWGSFLMDHLSSNQGCVMVTLLADGVDHTEIQSGTATENFSQGINAKAEAAYAQRIHRTVSVNGNDYFIQVFPPRSKVIMIGAAHITAALLQLAQDFDFETIVIDPRSTFARNTTFRVKPDQLVEKYPSEVLEQIALDPFTYAVILSHDPKIDDDALQVLLRSPVAYIGALGSRKNHEKRIARLKEKGFTEEEISRINAPIGIDIHAQGAKEIALSIMGDIIRAKNEFL
ncbi:MAG: XdhC family protein [Cyclobacteriaceae bacterium]|jgi:xanthine dehydrogenase accessory factor|nr:XdhC family protein [Cyclobacteriaceae bacterium]